MAPAASPTPTPRPGPVSLADEQAALASQMVKCVIFPSLADERALTDVFPDGFMAGNQDLFDSIVFHYISLTEKDSIPGRYSYNTTMEGFSYVLLDYTGALVADTLGLMDGVEPYVNYINVVPEQEILELMKSIFGRNAGIDEIWSSHGFGGDANQTYSLNGWWYEDGFVLADYTRVGASMDVSYAGMQEDGTHLFQYSFSGTSYDGRSGTVQVGLAPDPESMLGFNLESVAEVESISESERLEGVIEALHYVREVGDYDTDTPVTQEMIETVLYNVGYDNAYGALDFSASNMVLFDAALNPIPMDDSVLTGINLPADSELLNMPTAVIPQQTVMQILDAVFGGRGAGEQLLACFGEDGYMPVRYSVRGKPMGNDRI